MLDATRKVLVRALERHRLAADVPVGVLLSGGLDSSLLVGLMAKHLAADSAADSAAHSVPHVDNLLTFSIGFEGIPGVSVGAEKADEFEFSDQIAAQFKTRHQKHLIPNSEVLARLPEAVAAMTEPMMSHDVIAFYLLSERVSKEVKVVLAGQGADEVFGGYFWYPLMDAETGTAVERFGRHYFDRPCRIPGDDLARMAPTRRCRRDNRTRRARTGQAASRHLSRRGLALRRHHVDRRRSRQTCGQHADGLGPGSARALP